MRQRPLYPSPELLFVTALLVLSGAAGPEEGSASAQSRARSFQRGPANCQLQSGGESTVLGVAGPQTLRLADGRFVRLSEVLVPAATQTGFDPSLAAAAYLREAAVGRKVEVKFGGTQRDRYGVYVGQVYVPGEPGLWLQQELVSAGLATVFPQADNHACTPELLAFEAAAREQKRGHWGLAYYKLLDARDERSILNLVQTYQIVEGTVSQATESGGRITLHFGRSGKFGFIAVIDPAARKRFADKPAAESWEQTGLRIRGWIERRRGPAISVAQAEQIEFLTPNSATPPQEQDANPPK